MIVRLEKSQLYSTFAVESFEQLEFHIQNMAPSMVEYYLSDLASMCENGSTYINKSNIRQTLYIDEYSIFLDYDENIYLEFIQNQSDYETSSLW